MRRTDLPGGGEVSATATAAPGFMVIVGAEPKGIGDDDKTTERLTAAFSTTTAGISLRTMQQLVFTLALGADWPPQQS